MKEIENRGDKDTGREIGRMREMRGRERQRERERDIGRKQMVVQYYIDP